MPQSDRTVRLLHKLTTVLLLLLAGLVLPRAVAAQSGGTVRLIQVNADAFPSVSLYLEAYTPSGQFDSNLTRTRLHLLEEDQERPVERISKLQTGVQFIVALNEAPELANRYAGKSRFESVQAHLLEWARSQPITTHDDFSLATNTGLQFIRLQSPSEWVAVLASYQPNLLTAKPGLASLAQSLDLAAEPNPNPFMKRAILYITPLPAAADLEAYGNLAERARQQKVQVNVWLVASASVAERSKDAMDALQQLSKETGGSLMLFSGDEVLPDLENWLDRMRYTYQIDYTSAINTSGSYNLSVALDQAGASTQAASNRLPLQVEVSAPNPIFLSPPNLVQRTLSSPTDGSEPVLTPDSIPLQILIEFPDGHSRPLAYTRLMVDGVLVDENTAEPFDRFEWPVSDYTTSGPHQLSVQVEDLLGLQRTSIVTTIQVEAEAPAPAWWQRLFTRDRLLVIGAIFAAGTIFVVALLLRSRTGQPRLDAAARRRLIDPVTQPVPLTDDRRRPEVAHRQAWPGHAIINPTAPAWLVPLAEEGETGLLPRPLALSRREITFGSDPQLATIPLHSPTVSPLHARLSHEKDGSYMLADCGSVAGTWVNYAPISNQGTRLEHGDLVRLGKAAFRFELAHPPHIREAKVESQDRYDSD